jgi:hypothetical protein
MGVDDDDLSCPGSSVVAEGTSFENPESLETIGPDRISSFQSQSLIQESEKGGAPVNTDGTR